MSEEDAIDSYWKGLVECFGNYATEVQLSNAKYYGVLVLTENYSEHLNRNVQSARNNPRVKLHTKIEKNQIQQR